MRLLRTSFVSQEQNGNNGWFATVDVYYDRSMGHELGSRGIYRITTLITDAEEEWVWPCAELAAVRHCIWERRVLVASIPEDEENGQPYHGRNTRIEFSHPELAKMLQKASGHLLDRTNRFKVLSPVDEFGNIHKYASKLLNQFEGCQYDTILPSALQELKDHAERLVSGKDMPEDWINDVFDIGRASTATHQVLLRVAGNMPAPLYVSMDALSSYRLAVMRDYQAGVKRGFINPNPNGSSPAWVRLAKYLGKYEMSPVLDQHNFKFWVDELYDLMPDAMNITVYAQSMNRARPLPYFFVGSVPTLDNEGVRDVVLSIKSLFRSDIENMADRYRQQQNHRAYELGLLDKAYLNTNGNN